MSARGTKLVRRSDNSVVQAELLDEMAPPDLVLVEREWTPVRREIHQELLRRGTARTEWPESLHWDWSKKVPELKLLEANGLGIVCESQWQGVMLVKTGSHFARLESDRGKPLVYVDYLEAAPWNWNVRPVRRAGTFKGVGSVLLKEAVTISVAEGFHGRIALHALPQAETFYSDVCGMTPVDRDPAKQSLLYFEFSRERAAKYLGEGGAP